MLAGKPQPVEVTLARESKGRAYALADGGDTIPEEKR